MLTNLHIYNVSINVCYTQTSSIFNNVAFLTFTVTAFFGDDICSLYHSKLSLSAIIVMTHVLAIELVLLSVLVPTLALLYRCLPRYLCNRFCNQFLVIKFSISHLQCRDFFAGRRYGIICIPSVTESISCFIIA